MSANSSSSSSNSSSGTPTVDQLSDSQRSVLEQFTAVTAQDLTEAVPLLQRSQWNVEIAIAKFFDGEAVDPVAAALQEQENAAAAARVAARPSPPLPGNLTQRSSSNGISPAPRIVPQPSTVARRPPFLIFFLLLPFSILWRLTNSAVSLFYLLFPFLPRLRSSTRPTTKRTTNPRDTAARFIRTFEEEYGTATGLTWYPNGYAQALDTAKRNLRFLLVILQSDEHDDTQAFNKLTLTHSTVSDFLRRNDILLWGGSVQDSEAYQVSAALNCTKFPFAALITHVANAQSGVESSQGMSVVARIVGNPGPEAFVQKLQNAVDTHTPALERIRAERVAQAADRAIREEQNSAYEASLARDRERATERREAEERRKREEEEIARRAQEAEALERKREQWRKWRASVLPNEPTDGQVARVSIRMEDGQRIIRKFAKETKMEEVYAFVECVGLERLEERVAEPSEYDHSYRFRLVSVMPRKVFNPEDGLVGENLWPSGNLVVESLDDDE